MTDQELIAEIKNHFATKMFVLKIWELTTTKLAIY